MFATLYVCAFNFQIIDPNYESALVSFTRPFVKGYEESSYEKNKCNERNLDTPSTHDERYHTKCH